MYKNKILKQEAPTNLQQIVMSHTMFAPASTRVVHTCKLAQLTFAGFLISSGFHTCMGPHANRCMLSKLAMGQPLLWRSKSQNVLAACGATVTGLLYD